MVLLDAPASEWPAGLEVLQSFAAEAGLDLFDSCDVAGAVNSFCGARHGTVDLPRDYLLFLFVRAVCGSGGLLKDGSASSTLVSRMHQHADDTMFTRSLEVAEDPASLMEAHRRGLVTAGASRMAPNGCAVFVRLGKVMTRETENMFLLQVQAATRISQWVVDWRKGTGALRLIHITGGSERGGGESFRDLVRDRIRAMEKSSRLEPADLVWPVP